MRSCPACNQPLSGTDSVCPKCGISLHPYAHATDEGGSEGTSTYVLLIVGIGVTLVLLVCVGCLGVRNAWFRHIIF